MESKFRDWLERLAKELNERQGSEIYKILTEDDIQEIIDFLKMKGI